jgi:hypothetical protein
MAEVTAVALVTFTDAGTAQWGDTAPVVDNTRSAAVRGVITPE